MPPAAPTFEQILEDLETFEVERPELEPMRTLETQTSTVSSNCNTTTDNDDDDRRNSSSKLPVPVASGNPEQLMAQWLRTFDTFRADVQELHRLRRELQLCRADLTDRGQTIADEMEAIERRVTEALQQ